MKAARSKCNTVAADYLAQIKEHQVVDSAKARIRSFLHSYMDFFEEIVDIPEKQEAGMRIRRGCLITCAIFCYRAAGWLMLSR